MPCLVGRIIAMLLLGLGLLVADAQAAKPKASAGKGKTSIRTMNVADNIIAAQYGHFWVITDMTADETKELLVRLETMLGLISSYWGKEPGRMTIPCVVFKNMKVWPQAIMEKLHPEGIESVQSGGGVTCSQNLYLGAVAVQSTAVVYAPAEHGTPQHESVHAYCNLAFATTGPTWYSEGMAELGNYWREGDSAVNADPRIIAYLRGETNKKSLKEVLAPFQATGDCWQNYAWRWLLCHLMVNNPNYGSNFRKLGLKFLEKGRVDFPEAMREQMWARDFQETFGGQARELEFEYQYFLDHLETGYRVDLCAWDWKTKFQGLLPGGPARRSPVKANRGWQGSGVTVATGITYQYTASGTWKTAKDLPAVGAKGGESDRGRLLGVVMKDYKLGEPFPLENEGTFNAPGDGQLYLRINDKWTELADNTGSLNVEIRAQTRGK